jgi:hypothetical protein
MLWTRRPYQIAIHWDAWVWPGTVWRWNGGGYMGHGPDPYYEFHIGPFRFRKYGVPKR